MPSKIHIPKVNMAETTFKGLVGRKMSKTVKFMGEDIKVNKLSVQQVLEIQDLANDASTTANSTVGFDLLKKVIRMSAEGSDGLSDEEFSAFPMDELNKLSTEIMRFSGIEGDSKGK
jgi:hypothetical protein